MFHCTTYIEIVLHLLYTKNKSGMQPYIEIVLHLLLKINLECDHAYHRMTIAVSVFGYSRISFPYSWKTFYILGSIKKVVICIFKFCLCLAF